MRQFPHQCSKTNARVLQLGRSNKLYWEADGVDAHTTLLSIGFGVKTIDRQHNVFNRPTGEFVAENINLYFFIAVIKRAHGLRNALHR